MTAPAQRSQHLPSLDGLRACAITLVIISHLSATTHTPFTVPFGIVGDIGATALFAAAGVVQLAIGAMTHYGVKPGPSAQTS